MNRAARRAAARRDGTDSRTAARDRANAELRKLVGRIHESVDAYHAEHMDPRVTCREGCAHCCETVVFADSAEGLYIVANEAEAVRRAMPRIVEQERILDRTFTPSEIAALPYAGETSSPELVDVGARYRDLRMKCAFLDDSDRCSIYASRPLACRTHFSLEEPERCAIRHGTQRIWNTPARLGAQIELLAEAVQLRGGVEVGFFQSIVRAAYQASLRRGRR